MLLEDVCHEINVLETSIFLISFFKFPPPQVPIFSPFSLTHEIIYSRIV